MTITIEQRKWLHDYLYQTMQYRETVEEVYDHVLLALETYPEPRFFETAVMDVIDNQFGGNNGLLALEDSYKESTETAMEERYLADLKSWLTLPKIVFAPAMFFTLIYLNTKFNLMASPAFIGVQVLCMLLFLSGSFRIGAFSMLGHGVISLMIKIFGPKKTTIKYEVLMNVIYRNRIISFLIIAVCACGSLTYHGLYPHLKGRQYNFIGCSLFLTLITIHLLVIVKIYREDLQKRMIKI